MFTQLKYNYFWKVLVVLIICSCCIYGFSNAPMIIKKIFQLSTSYIALGFSFAGFLWACFTPKLEDRTGVAFYFGGMFLAFVAFELGLETTNSESSKLIFNVLTALSVVLLYRKN